MFFLISPTGIHKCWDEGDAYMLETEVVYDDYLRSGTMGRINKRFLGYILSIDERWDLRSQDWGKGYERAKSNKVD